MAKNYGEDLYGNESDACSFCGAKRRDGAILLSSSKGCNICSKCIAKGYQMLIENDVLHDEAASRRKEQKNTAEVRHYSTQKGTALCCASVMSPAGFEPTTF